MTNPRQLTIVRSDDWHLHLRDGQALETTVLHAAAQFSRAIIMPNLKEPIVNAELAAQYRQRILAVRDKVAPQSTFEPLMTLYLTDRVTPEVIRQAAWQGVVACKLYPAGATTNSDAGVTDLKHIYPALEAMQAEGLILLMHGEVTDPSIDLFDREVIFLERHLEGLRRDFPELKMVLEHITTKEAAEYVEQADKNLGATITAHHLLFNRNAIFLGGLRPHYYCLPVLKREVHRQALIKAATSANPKFFLGSDSAPHAAVLKEAAVGCAGCYTAAAAIELYAQAFEQAGALDKLEAFASFFGADFYGLERNKETIVLEEKAWTIPDSFAFGAAVLKPLCAGEQLNWQRKA